MDSKALIKLFDKYKTGDKKSLELLCRKAEECIRPHFIQRFTDENIVNDLCQDTYIRLLKGFKSLLEPIKFRSFVLKTAFYVVQDHYRKSAKIQIDSNKINLDDTKEILLNSDPSLDEMMLFDFDLRSAIQKLPEKSQLILQLNSEGFKYCEISKIVEMSESGVKMQVKRSIEKLKSLLVA